MTTTCTRAPMQRNGRQTDGFSSPLDRLDEPLGFEAGDANLYRYVGNAPTNNRDPTGLSFLSDYWYYLWHPSEQDTDIRIGQGVALGTSAVCLTVAGGIVVGGAAVAGDTVIGGGAVAGGGGGVGGGAIGSIPVIGGGGQIGAIGRPPFNWVRPWRPPGLGRPPTNLGPIDLPPGWQPRIGPGHFPTCPN